MKETKINEDDIKKLVDVLGGDKTEHKAFVLIPSLDGFDIHEVHIETAKHAIYAEGVRIQWKG